MLNAGWWVLVVACGSLFASTAAAQPPSVEQERTMVQKALQDDADHYFNGCDGYGAARKAGDGMTSIAFDTTFGRPLAPMMEAGAGDTLRRTPQFGLQGIANCGAALSDMTDLPQYWMRKVSLLRARALHRFAVGDAAGADADLAAAFAAVQSPDDPFYARSMKLALQLEHAFLLSRSGHQTEADTLAMSAWSKRPYARETAYSAIVAMGPGADADDLRKIERQLSALDPSPSTTPGFTQPVVGSDVKLPTASKIGQDSAALYNFLPEPETPLRIAPEPEHLRKPGLSAAAIPATPTAGETTGAVRVSFHGSSATLPIAEEQALLSAAEMAEAVGKPGFIIVSRADSLRVSTHGTGLGCTVVVYAPGISVLAAALIGAVGGALNRNNDCGSKFTYADGYETDLQVSFVDRVDSTPPADARMIEVGAVRAELGPVYRAAASPGAP